MQRHVLLVLGFCLLAAPLAAAEDPAADEALAKILEVRDRREYGRAMEELQELLEQRPGNLRILVELAKTAYWQALEIFQSESPTLGRLALEDAIKWSRNALVADPGNVAALQILGAAAVNAADYETGVEAYSRLAALDPADGESRYWHGYCLAFAGRFPEALEAFDAAGEILGPQPRILLNRAICHESLGDVGRATHAFIALIDAEVAADRAASTEAKSAWEHLWKIHRERGLWEEAVQTFSVLAERHPKLTSPHWYLAHAQLARGNSEGAARAFARVTEILPTYAEGWRQLGETRLAAGDFAGAETAVATFIEVAAESEAPRDLLLELARAMAASGKRPEAVALLARSEPSFPGDPWVIAVRGDLLFAEGEFPEALDAYREALTASPHSESIRCREQKTVTAMLRAGQVPPGSRPYRPEPESREPGGRYRNIFDFEGSSVFVRNGGMSEGRREGGRFFLRRTGLKGQMAYLKLEFIPTFDTRPFVAVRVDVNGPAGSAMIVRLKDAYDQFEMSPNFLRLTWPRPVALTGEWQKVTLTLDGFRSTSANRPLPFNRARLRALILEIGENHLNDAPLPFELAIDDVTLVAEDGSEVVLEDFEGSPKETLFLSDGSAIAFARTLFRPEEVEQFRPDPNTYVSPAIFGAEYDRSMVHSGEGAFRLVLRGRGEASGVLSFNPDRSFDRAGALTFFAKGAEGGERLRVTIRDALDNDLSNPSPASAPRMEVDGRLLEGWFVLTQKWREYRIERSDFPDVDFDSLAAIRFCFGAPEGNEPGTTIYLDDIAWR